MPLSGNPRATSFWEPVVEKVSQKLYCWKRSYISMEGRITLIKTVLSNIPVYYMSIFKMPWKVASFIENFWIDFLWEGGGKKKDHLVK